LDSVVVGLHTQILNDAETNLELLFDVQTYFAQSVALPELKVNAEAFKRDSRPYMMPMQDEPLGAITVKFYLESPKKPQGSVIYQLLDTWRAYVRGGRGAYSQEGFIPTLDADWKLTYAFDVLVTLYRGCSSPQLIDYFSGVSASTYGHVQAAFMNEVNNISDPDLKIKKLESLRIGAGLKDPVGIQNDLEKCGMFSLDKMWLSSFKISELNYQQGNQIVTLDATFFAENIRDVTF
jgi:hypothetical protein